MIAQPVRSLLSGWKKSPSEITQFMAIVSAPWVIKPIYGLLIDFVPLFGSRRRNYLLLATLMTAVSLFCDDGAVLEFGALVLGVCGR